MCAVDGCEHTFRELADEVLPGYMAELHRLMAAPRPMLDFAQKGIGVRTLLREAGATARVGLDATEVLEQALRHRLQRELARHLGHLSDGQSEEEFWASERDAAYEAWKRPLPK